MIFWLNIWNLLTIKGADQGVFPEISYDKIDKARGMNITVVTTAESDEEGKSLLTAFGMPFRR